MSKAYREAIEKDKKLSPARFTDVDCSNLPSMTVQAAADEVDINKIMARVEKGHTIMTSQGTPFYGDVSEFDGLQEAIIKVQEADELFMQVPAKIREKFRNDPVEFVKFLEDPENLDEARVLGLAKPKEVVESPPVPEPGANIGPK